MGVLAVSVLGPVTVRVDDVPLELGSRKQRALLALLALHPGRVLSVDRLVDDLWGEDPPATAHHALQVHVSNLRKALGPDLLATERPGYVLRTDNEVCDATHFEDLVRRARGAPAEEALALLRTALGLWRGPALEDLSAEPFAAREAARLDELRLRATEEALVAELSLGAHAELVGQLEQLTREHPLRERFWELRILATYRAGRQAEALQAYQQLRVRLRDELGLDASPTLQQLEAAVLRHDPSLTAPAAALPETAAVDRPETRRVVTVVAAGVAGLDAVARGLDPEDVGALLDRCTQTMADVVTVHGGTLEHAMAGELLAVFGAPTAHEDDAERAVRAATALHNAVTEDPQLPPGLTVRAGVATGEVLLARGQVVGDVVREARSLQLRAAEGEAEISAASRRRTRPGHDLASFIGRAADLQMLLAAWERTVRSRRPHLVTVLGEPGVGKSRLLAELLPQLDDGQVLIGRCPPYGQTLTYAPLQEVLRTAAGVGLDEPPATARQQLGRLTGDPDLARHLALLTGLDDEHDRAAGLVDERTLHAAFIRWAGSLALRSPLCLVLEDAHWADIALLDLVQAMARRVRDVPLLVVVLARAELLERHPSWARGIAAHSSTNLAPLDPGSTSRLVAELGSAHGLASDELSRIAQRSGGNPLFAEELVATFAEGATGVPASLSSLLLARLDALPHEQQAALRRASVLGPSFSAEGVEALGSSRDSLDEALADLEQRDLLRAEAVTAWAFKHALVRDAAYASLPRQERRDLHAMAADWLTSVAGDRLPELSEQLARHALAADQPRRALELLLIAAERARHAASHRRESALLEDAIAIAEQLADRPLAGDVRARRGVALSRLALWSEARDELRAALTELPGTEVRRRAEVCCDLSTASFWMLDTAAISEYAQQALELATAIGARDIELAARAQLTNAHSATGDVERVLVEGRELVSDATSWGLTPPYSRLGAYSLQLYLTGDWNRAVTLSRSAVSHGRSSGDTQGVLWNLPHIGMAAASAGRFDEALAVFAEARRFGEEHELHAGLPRAIAMSAGFHLDLFDYAGAQAIQEEARERGREHFPPSAVSAGIDLLFNFVRRGDVGSAEPMVDLLGQEVASGGGWHGWLWHLRFTQLRAELAFARGELQEAVDLARESLHLSRTKSRTKYEVHALLTAGRALHAQGRTADALAQARKAQVRATALASPALQVVVAAASMSIEPDAAAAADGAAAVRAVLDGLSEPLLRNRFLAADDVMLM
jgi:DNA-binding SARP family transcriptional activator